MLIYTFDTSPDGLLSAIFDAFSRHERPDTLIGTGEQLPLFADNLHHVATAEDKAQRVWSGLERRLSPKALKIITLAYLSEDQSISQHLFNYFYKAFSQPETATSIEQNYADPDVLAVTNIAQRVLHERLRMMQFLRFQKAADGTYLGVISPDHNVLPLITDHFRDRFGDQPWLIYDARRHYGYYYDRQQLTHVTFADGQTLPFDLATGKLNDDTLSADDKLFQELWRTYFKAICIRERINPKKQLCDMPRRYWRYMTEKQ